MSSFPEPGRQVAHIMLDSVIASGTDGSVAEKAAVTELALQRINEVDGGVPVVVEGSEDAAVSIDLSQMWGAAMITLGRAVELLAEARHVSAEDVVGELREYIDL